MNEVLLEDATISILNQARRDGRGVRRKIEEQKCGSAKCWGLTFGILGSSAGEKISVRRKIEPQKKTQRL